MNILGLRKKEKEQNKGGSCCSEKCDCETMKEAVKNQSEGARVKILGTGCAKCIALEENVKEALKTLGLDTEVDHVKDFADIASYGVMSTPAVVVDGRVVSYGKVLKVEEAVEVLKKVM